MTPPGYRHDPAARLRPINWNRVADEKDLEVWNRLTANFWLPEKVPLSNDIPDWQRLTPQERTLTMRVFTGLTMLDTVQATVGEICQIADARTEHEEAVYTNIAFMQSVHARSYSSVFSTLTSTPEIDDAYRWAVANDGLQQRAKAVLVHYYANDPLRRKVASTLLSSLLLYAGFYLPLHFACHARLTNTADMVRLILRDKAVHGYYSGHKYQRGLEVHPQAEQDAMRAFTYELLDELYELELAYSGELFTRRRREPRLLLRVGVLLRDGPRRGHRRRRLGLLTSGRRPRWTRLATGVSRLLASLDMPELMSPP